MLLMSLPFIFETLFCICNVDTQMFVKHFNALWKKWNRIFYTKTYLKIRDMAKFMPMLKKESRKYLGQIML